MKVPARFRLFVSYALFLVSFAFPEKSIGSSLLYLDDFSSIDLSHWEIFSNPGGIVNINSSNYINLSAIPGKFFPYMYLKNVTIPEYDYSIEVKIKYSGSLTYGNGLIFTDNLLSNSTTSNLGPNDYIFSIWPINNSTANIGSSLCLSNSVNCIDGSYNSIINVPSNEWIELKIKAEDNRYIVTIGNQSFETQNISRKITSLWIGNPQKTNTVQNWPTIDVDYIRVSVETKTKPTIIIPGLGASWDIGAILGGTEGTNWQIPSFVKNYEGLIGSFVNAGYIESGTEQNLFVFPYDWRKPLDTLADRLDTYINNLTLPPNEKVNLVGHSMGGLIARAYVQKYGDAKVNQVVTVGSPHLGAVRAYEVWEGAKIWKGAWWAKTALEMITHFGSVNGESKVQTVRRLAPSIKDLLPVYDFLSYNNVLLPWNTLRQQNTYLNDLNTGYTAVDGLLTTIFGRDIQTDKIVNVGPPSGTDLWEDGEPLPENPFVTDLGDGTVTEQSAKGPFSTSVPGIGWHDELVTKSENISLIFESLGLDTSKALGGYDSGQGAVFIATLMSPGSLSVCNQNNSLCNNDLGVYIPEHKLFILPDFDGSSLNVKVTEDGLGEYKLHLGGVDDDPNWVIMDGVLHEENQEDQYLIAYDESSVSALYIDTTPPKVTIISPSNQKYFAKTLPSLDYTVTDNYDENPDVNINGWSKSLGWHTVTVTATDDAGNSNSASVTYFIEKPAKFSEVCKKNGWRAFWWWRFRNQGDCIRFIDFLESHGFNFNWPKYLWRWY